MFTKLSASLDVSGVPVSCTQLSDIIGWPVQARARTNNSGWGICFFVQYKTLRV